MATCISSCHLGVAIEKPLAKALVDEKVEYIHFAKMIWWCRRSPFRIWSVGTGDAKYPSWNSHWYKVPGVLLHSRTWKVVRPAGWRGKRSSTPFLFCHWTCNVISITLYHLHAEFSICKIRIITLLLLKQQKLRKSYLSALNIGIGQFYDKQGK